MKNTTISTRLNEADRTDFIAMCRDNNMETSEMLRYVIKQYPEKKEYFGLIKELFEHSKDLLELSRNQATKITEQDKAISKLLHIIEAQTKGRPDNAPLIPAQEGNDGLNGFYNSLDKEDQAFFNAMTGELKKNRLETLKTIFTAVRKTASAKKVQSAAQDYKSAIKLEIHETQDNPA